MKTISLVLFSILILFSCQTQSRKVDYAVDPNNHEVVVNEVYQGNSYSYLKVKEKGDTYWMAILKTDLVVGETYYYSEVMEMNNFFSKDLNRTFDKIMFVGNLSPNPIPLSTISSQTMIPKSKGSVVSGKLEISMEKYPGTITVDELYSNREKYKGTTIKLSGEITRFNPSIMGKNWAHIQDGTGSDTFYDLTFTTQEVISVGDRVLVEGKVSLDKDLGSGYFFEILLEDAAVEVINMQ